MMCSGRPGVIGVVGAMRARKSMAEDTLEGWQQSHLSENVSWIRGNWRWEERERPR